MRYMTKEEVDKFKKTVTKEMKLLKELTNLIILSLYKLDPITIITTDGLKLKKEKINYMDANWGNLECVKVEKRGKEWIIYLKQADSRELENYVKKWLRRWGWNNIKVITEV